jgi:hypothetical protein
MLKDTDKDYENALAKAYDAANSATYRLFFLREVFETLGSPNINGIEFSTQAICGLSEILGDSLGKAMDAVKIIDHIGLREHLNA